MGIKNLSKRVWNDYWSLSLPTQVLILVLIGLGLYFRVSNLFNLGYVWDLVTTQYEWSKNANEMNLLVFWKNYELFYDYPPLILIFESLLYKLIIPIGASAQQFVTLVKTFNFIIDIILVFIFFKLGYKYNFLDPGVLIILVSIFFSSPGVWFVSAVWGQVDTAISIFIIGVLYLLSMTNNNWDSKKRININILSDKNFLTGVFFALSFVFKQQAILLAPVFIIYYFSNISFKKLYKLLPFLLIFGLSFIYGYNLYLSGVFDNIQSTILIILILQLIYLIFGSFIKNSWFNFYRFLLGIFLLLCLFYLPLFFQNYERSGSVLFAFLNRGNNLNGQASNMWKLLDIRAVSSDVFFETPFIKFQYGMISIVIVLTVITAIFVSRYRVFETLRKGYKKIKLELLTRVGLDFSDLVLILYIINGTLYLVMPGMHSRYLQLAVILGWLVMLCIKLKTNLYLWLVSILTIHIGYFLTQLGPYSGGVFGVGNPYPVWVKEFVKYGYFTNGYITSSLILYPFIITLFIALLSLVDRKSKDPLLTKE